MPPCPLKDFLGFATEWEQTLVADDRDQAQWQEEAACLRLPRTQRRLPGVRLVACTMTMDLLGIQREELIEGVEVGGVATYLDRAQSGNLSPFIWRARPTNDEGGRNRDAPIELSCCKEDFASTLEARCSQRNQASSNQRNGYCSIYTNPSWQRRPTSARSRLLSPSMSGGHPDLSGGPGCGVGCDRPGGAKSGN
jgi:hypothetical protein